MLFGKGKKPKTLESSITNLNKSLENSIADLKNDMQKVQCELERVAIMQNEQHSSSKLLGELKSEMATVKGILLSRQDWTQIFCNCLFYRKKLRNEMFFLDTSFQL